MLAHDLSPCIHWSGRLDLNQRPLHPECRVNNGEINRLALSLGEISSFLSQIVRFGDVAVTNL